MLTVLSLFPFYFIGLGYFVLFLGNRNLLCCQNSNQRRARLLALIFLIGISANNLIVLIVEEIRLSLIVGMVLSLIGLLIATIIQRKTILKMLQLGWLPWGGIIFLALMYGFAILIEPLNFWDARSEWFFHGKIIFYNQSLGRSVGWNDPSIAFSHPDYPKLVAVLAAQFAYLFGYWNEHMPKLSLGVFLIPTLFATFSFFKRNILSLLYLIIFFYFSLEDFLFSGLMDGYFALFAVFSILFWAQWLTTGDDEDFLVGAVFLSNACSMKNEGFLYALSIGLSLLLLIIIRKPNDYLKGMLSKYHVIALTALCFFNSFLWTWKRIAWGLNSYLDIGFNSLQRILIRISEGAIPLVAQYLLINSNVYKGLIILVLTLIVSIILRVKITKSVWLAVMTAATYVSGMFFLYLSTPTDLTWILDTTADRTMITVLHCVFCATFIVLNDINASIGSTGQ